MIDKIRILWLMLRDHGVVLKFKDSKYKILLIPGFTVLLVLAIWYLK